MFYLSVLQAPVVQNGDLFLVLQFETGANVQIQTAHLQVNVSYR
jgi:hypothetical protein